MSTVVNLTRMDIAPIEYPGNVLESDPHQETGFSNEFKRWLANFVDVFNTNMTDIEVAVASLDARITALGG